MVFYILYTYQPLAPSSPSSFPYPPSPTLPIICRHLSPSLFLLGSKKTSHAPSPSPKLPKHWKRKDLPPQTGLVGIAIVQTSWPLGDSSQFGLVSILGQLLVEVHPCKSVIVCCVLGSSRWDCCALVCGSWSAVAGWAWSRQPSGPAGHQPVRPTAHCHPGISSRQKQFLPYSS